MRASFIGNTMAGHTKASGSSVGDTRSAGSVLTEIGQKAHPKIRMKPDDRHPPLRRPSTAARSTKAK